MQDFKTFTDTIIQALNSKLITQSEASKLFLDYLGLVVGLKKDEENTEVKAIEVSAVK